MGRRHIYAYDFIRAIAIIMVVAVHCIPGRAETSAAHFYNTLFQAALFPCNVLFFILSGLLNIHADYESHYLDYALRKLRSILLPTLVFMFINTVVDMVGLPGADFVTIAKQFLTNSFSSYSDSIFWFVMAIFAMILVAPFFANSFERMKRDACRFFSALFLVFSALNLVGFYLGIGFGWSWPTSMFFIVFLLGPSIGHIKIKHPAVPWAIFCACVAVSTLLIMGGLPHHPADDNTPFYFLAGGALFLCLRQMGERLKSNRFISVISKYSFDIYMCHIMLLPHMPDFLLMTTRPLAHIALTASVLVASLIVSIVAEYLVIKPLQNLVSHIQNGLSSSAES